MEQLQLQQTSVWTWREIMIKEQIEGIIQIFRNRGWIRNNYHTKEGVCLTGAVAIFEGHSLVGYCKQPHGKIRSCIDETQTNSPLHTRMQQDIGSLISYNDRHGSLQGLEISLREDFEI